MFHRLARRRFLSISGTFAAAIGWAAVCMAATAGVAVRPHPRLFTDAAGFESVKAGIATDELVRLGAENARYVADRALGRPLPVHRVTDGRRMLSISRQACDDIMNLAMSYRLFGDRRHLEKAEEVMREVAAFKDWNPSHFLDVAVMALGVSVGYDWLYGELSPEARAAIRAGLVRNGLDAGLAKPGVRKACMNWGQVCTGGILAAALAVAEDEPEKFARMIDETRRFMPDVMKMYLPNGSYPEGPGYWHFGTSYNVMAIAMLESALGDDLGLLAQPAFRETGQYLDLMTGPSGFLFNYSDGSYKRDPTWITWWFAKRFGEPGWVEPFEREAYAARLRRRKGEEFASPLALFYLFRRPDGVKVSLPLAWRSGGTTDLTVQRSDWTKDGRFAAFKGGKATNKHGHMDGGSFVYDAKGVRWAWDIGGENYAKIEHVIGLELWRYEEGSPRYRIFRIGPFSHNTLTLDGLPHSATGDVRVLSLKGGTRSEAALDLTPLFTNATRVVRRGLMLADGFRIADSVEGLRAGAPIRWAMMTKAQVSRDGDGLVLSEGGKTLCVTRDVPPGASAWSVVENPHGEEWETPNEGFRQISFTVPSVPSGVEFCVTFR